MTDAGFPFGEDILSLIRVIFMPLSAVCAAGVVGASLSRWTYLARVFVYAFLVTMVPIIGVSVCFVLLTPNAASLAMVYVWLSMSAGAISALRLLEGDGPLDIGESGH